MHSTKRYKFSAFLQVQFPMLKSHPCERQTFHKILLKFMIISRAALSFPTLLQIDYLKIKKKGLEIAQHQRKFTLMRWKHRPVPSTLSRKVGLMDEWFIAQLLDIKTFTLCAIEQHIMATTLTLNFRLTHVAIAFDDTFSSDPIPTSVNGERSFVRAGQTQPCIQAITFSSPFPLHLALHRMQFAKRKRKKFLAKVHKGIRRWRGKSF